MSAAAADFEHLYRSLRLKSGLSQHETEERALGTRRRQLVLERLFRETLEELISLSIEEGVACFSGGDVFGQLRHEVLEIEARLKPHGIAASRKMRRKVSRNQRLRLFERDSFTCQTCGFAMPKEDYVRWIAKARQLPPSGRFLTLDHLVPEALGGDVSDENLVTICNRCNAEKGTRLVA